MENIFTKIFEIMNKEILDKVLNRSSHSSEFFQVHTLLLHHLGKYKPMYEWDNTNEYYKPCMMEMSELPPMTDQLLRLLDRDDIVLLAKLAGREYLAHRWELNEYSAIANCADKRHKYAVKLLKSDIEIESVRLFWQALYLREQTMEAN